MVKTGGYNRSSQNLTEANTTSIPPSDHKLNMISATGNANPDNTKDTDPKVMSMDIPEGRQSMMKQSKFSMDQKPGAHKH